MNNASTMYDFNYADSLESSETPQLKSLHDTGKSVLQCTSNIHTSSAVSTLQSYPPPSSPPVFSSPLVKV